jgi:hypothetical protein
MNRLIACMTGGAAHQTFGGNATTAHSVSIDLSQIYVAASWVGTVELAIIAAVGLGLWLRERKFASASDLRPADQDFVKASKPGAVAGLIAEGDR